MNVGVVMWPIEPWPAMGERWQQAEELGFHAGWVYDHLAWRGHTPWDDAYASLAAAAALTSSIRVGTLVTSSNFRHPLATASAIKTIDRISRGRFTLGIGAGGTAHTSDGDVLDIEWTPRQRADRFAEWVGQLHALLTESPISVTGEYWSARGVTIAPGLVQQRPPFLIAGEGPRGMRLAAAFGQGWIANPQSPDGPGIDLLTTQLSRLETICAQQGRDFASMPKLLLTGFTADPWLESLGAFQDLYGRYAEAGVTDVAIHWPRPDSDWDTDSRTFEAIADYSRQAAAPPAQSASPQAG